MTIASADSSIGVAANKFKDATVQVGFSLLSADPLVMQEVQLKLGLQRGKCKTSSAGDRAQFRQGLDTGPQPFRRSRGCGGLTPLFPRGFGERQVPSTVGRAGPVYRTAGHRARLPTNARRNCIAWDKHFTLESGAIFLPWKAGGRRVGGGGARGRGKLLRVR